MKGGEQWLGVGLGAAQGEAANGLGTEGEFAPDQAVRPGGINEQTVGKEGDAAGVVGAADEDDGGVRAGWQARGRPGLACGSGFLAGLGFVVMSCDEAVGAVAQGGGAGVVEAVPDLGLPELVEGFDLVLEAVFAGWGKDGDDAQGQTEEDDGTKPVGVVMGAMEAEVVVELGKGGQPVRAPVGEQGADGTAGGDGGGGEAGAEAAVQGDAVEDLHLAVALDDQSLDDIKSVQFGLGGGDGREMPARRRRGAAVPPGGTDHGVALEDVGDGGAAGQGLAGRELVPQRAADGDRAELPQGVVFLKVVSQSENALDQPGRQGGGRAVRAAGQIRKLHALQALSGGTPEPVLHVGKGESELAGDLA